MDGVIIIDKEKNCTSNDVVKRVKKLLNTKVGHTGTLDPNATGVLPLLLGEGTKISKYLINHDKEYEATIQLGVKTTTADVEGEIVEKIDVNPQILNKENIDMVLKEFIGKQQQIPPIYSAIKVNGKKLYEYARNGQEVKIEPRNIEIYEILLVEINKEKNQIVFNVKCSKGTYIRSLCEDISEKLGTIGYMLDLRRKQVGEFEIEKSIKINELEEKKKNNDYSNIITIEEIFKKNEQVEIDDEMYNKYLNGIAIPVQSNTNGVCRVYLNSKFIGLGILKDSKVKRDLVL